MIQSIHEKKSVKAEDIESCKYTLILSLSLSELFFQVLQL